jgi:hypothetical protein
MAKGGAGSAVETPSRLFYAVVASGIALGAAACSVSVAVADGEANGTAGAAGRTLATPSVGEAGAGEDAEALDASVLDASGDAHALHDGGRDASTDGGDAGWNPTK